MKLFGTVLILSLFVLGHCASVMDLPEVSTTPSSIPIAKKTTTKKTTVPEPTTTEGTTTTTAKTTTEPVDTTTTVKTTTTSEPTTTSTSTSTEPATSTSTTTTTTTSTTTPPPTPAPTPGPTPKPEPVEWNVTDNTTNVTCIMVRALVWFNVTYPTTDNKTARADTFVPKTSRAVGECGNGTTDQRITVQWGAGNEFLMLFHLNESTKEYALSGLTVTLNTTQFVNGSDGQIIYTHLGSEFATRQQMSYYCNKVQTFNLTANETSKDVVGTVNVSQTHLEAFHKEKNAHYSAASDCDMPSTPDVVPIAVGISLILLVLVVLVAYLVGRRRAQARGYVSM